MADREITLPEEVIYGDPNMSRKPATMTMADVARDFLPAQYRYIRDLPPEEQNKELRRLQEQWLQEPQKIPVKKTDGGARDVIATDAYGKSKVMPIEDYPEFEANVKRQELDKELELKQYPWELLMGLGGLYQDVGSFPKGVDKARKDAAQKIQQEAVGEVYRPQLSKPISPLQETKPETQDKGAIYESIDAPVNYAAGFSMPIKSEGRTASQEIVQASKNLKLLSPSQMAKYASYDPVKDLGRYGYQDVKMSAAPTRATIMKDRYPNLQGLTDLDAAKELSIMTGKPYQDFLIPINYRVTYNPSVSSFSGGTNTLSLSRNARNPEYVDTVLPHELRHTSDFRSNVDLYKPDKSYIVSDIWNQKVVDAVNAVRANRGKKPMNDDYIYAKVEDETYWHGPTREKFAQMTGFPLRKSDSLSTVGDLVKLVKSKPELMKEYFQHMKETLPSGFSDKEIKIMLKDYLKQLEINPKVQDRFLESSMADKPQQEGTV